MDGDDDEQRSVGAPEYEDGEDIEREEGDNTTTALLQSPLQRRRRGLNGITLLTRKLSYPSLASLMQRFCSTVIRPEAGGGPGANAVLLHPPLRRERSHHLA